MSDPNIDIQDDTEAPVIDVPPIEVQETQEQGDTLNLEYSRYVDSNHVHVNPYGKESDTPHIS